MESERTARAAIAKLRSTPRNSKGTRRKVRAFVIRLNEKATEEQDTQYYDDGNNDNLDQTHDSILNVFGAKNDAGEAGRILEAPTFSVNQYLIPLFLLHLVIRLDY